MKTRMLIVMVIFCTVLLYAAKIATPYKLEIDIDNDGDKLCNSCENEIFGTNEDLLDTDDDGIPDGDEDHDEDGLTNLEEQNKIQVLFDALREGDTESVLALLDYSPYLLFVTPDPCVSALTMAAHGGIEMIKALLDAGVDVNEKIGTSGLTALMCVCEPKVMKVLLDAGAEVNAKDKWGQTALMSAIDCYFGLALEFGFDTALREAVELLLNAGADIHAVDSDGNTALLYATKHGYVRIVRSLLEAGAEVNAHDDNGFTALMLASSRGHKKVAELLIDSGADINDQNKTALIAASITGHINVVHLLLKRGADINAQDNGGWTALIATSWGGHTEVAELLIGEGADVNVQTNNGDTALKYALEKEYTDIVKLLIEAGEKEY